MGSRILQVGYDWVSPGAEGYGLAGEPGSPVDLVRTTNARLERTGRPARTSSTWKSSPA